MLWRSLTRLTSQILVFTVTLNKITRIYLLQRGSASGSATLADATLSLQRETTDNLELDKLICQARVSG